MENQSFSRGRRLAALIPLMEVRSVFTGRRGVIAFDPQAEDVRGSRNDVGPVMTSALDYTHDRRLIELGVPSERRQKKLLFSAKVSRPLPSEELEKHPASLVRRLRPGALELQCREQPLVVLVG